MKTLDHEIEMFQVYLAEYFSENAIGGLDGFQGVYKTLLKLLILDVGLPLSAPVIVTAA